MLKQPYKLVIVQTVTPDYRSDFFKEIKKNLKERFELYGGSSYFDCSIKSDKSINKKNVKNYFLFNRKLLFQTGIWHLLFKDITLVLEMNPRIISNWIFLIIRKFLNKETVLWGHAWSKSGKKSKPEKLRNLMKHLSSKIVVYSNSQKKELKERMPKKVILAAPNALISATKMTTLTPQEHLNLIYVGRLTKHKKPFFLVKAFVNNLDEYPKNTKLIIVGDGVEKQRIKEYVINNKLENRIELKGHVGDYETLRNLYATSLFSVSPSLAGLSITQSFSFGVPMLISEQEQHGPEIEAVNLNTNALYFESNNIEDFNKVLINVFENREYWFNQRKDIVSFCKNSYSIEAMAKTFINLI
jgi:glycosyltransferase involved in cell wall biosynthesis